MEIDISKTINDRNITLIRQCGASVFGSDASFLDEDTGNVITPLHLAVRLEYCDVVEELLNLGAKVNAESTSGKIPIEELQFRSDAANEVCALILDRSRSCYPSNAILYSLILRAIECLHPGSVDVLIRKGAPVLESSNFIGHFRTYVTTPLLSWAGMELNERNDYDKSRHSAIGDLLLSSHQPSSHSVHRALFRAITVGNREATEAIIRHGVKLVCDSKDNIFQRDALISAMAGHYSVKVRDDFIRLILNSGYRVTNEVQEVWVKNVLPSLLVCPGMTCSTARLLFSVIGNVSRNNEIWDEAINYAETEGPEVDLIPEIMNGLIRLRNLDSMSLTNMCRDSIRSRTIWNTNNSSEWIREITAGFPQIVRRFLLLEDIFHGT